MNEDQIKTLCQYFSVGEVLYIGPYSDTMRPLTVIDNKGFAFGNGNRILFQNCEPTDFGILTRLSL